MQSRMKVALLTGAFAATLGLGVAIGTASADQPHMFNALRDLRQARGELDVHKAA